MAKADRNGKEKPAEATRRVSRTIGGIIDSMARDKNNKPQLGSRQTILEAYKSGGIKAAYKAASNINSRFGKEVFTKATVDGWIAEYNNEKKTGNYNQGESRKEDDDAR